MSVFRVEKTRDYTVMSNTHLKDQGLSLKAKGLMSFMLSLPETWDYTLRGLTIVNKDGIDAIREAVRELERAGYVQRRRVRNEKGQLAGNEYVIYEQPQPALENPTLDNPTQEKPTLGKPTLENPMTNKVLIESSTKESITEESNPYQSNPGRGFEGMGYDEAREIVKANIEYDYLWEKDPISEAQLNGIVDLIAEVLCSGKESMVIAGAEYPVQVVRERFLKLDSSHIEYVFDCMRENTTCIRNIKKYLLAALFNAPSTIDSYYASQVNHDLYGDSL
ncbi:MAG: hypothetical protein ENTB_01868 [Enterocloster aldenensis]